MPQKYPSSHLHLMLYHLRRILSGISPLWIYDVTAEISPFKAFTLQASDSFFQESTVVKKLASCNYIVTISLLSKVMECQGQQ